MQKPPWPIFFANGALALGKKLGPILWQLPPNFHFHPERLEEFLNLLPRDTKTAARLARRHDHRVEDRTYFQVGRNRKLRHAIEIRHDSFRVPEFIALLRRHNIALVCADTVEWPLMMDITADFLYCRLHGSEQLYTSGYDDSALRSWASLTAAWSRGEDPRTQYPKRGEHISKRKPPRRASRDVFVFFDNDAKVRAPADARRLTAFIAAPDRRRARSAPVNTNEISH
jgi:uncharacterized protein YecE (DUF72 family)